MSWMIWLKCVSLSNFRRHVNSLIYDCINGPFFFVPLILLNFCFTQRHMLSTFWVCLVWSFASTNPWVWFTVSCLYCGSRPSLLYALHSSVSILVPGRTIRCMIGMRVAASRRWTTCRNTLLGLSLSTPPNTHFPSTIRPLWYFLLPNLDSSIWKKC